jgi:hypothetical protein
MKTPINSKKKLAFFRMNDSNRAHVSKSAPLLSLDVFGLGNRMFSAGRSGKPGFPMVFIALCQKILDLFTTHCRFA